MSAVPNLHQDREEMAAILGQKTLCIVTGASRGIGCEIATRLAKEVGEGSVLCLTARDSVKLDETRKAIDSATNELGKKVRVVVHAVDMQTATNQQLDSLLDAIEVGDERFSVLILIHNAGSLICEKLTTQFDDVAETDAYFHLNVTSTVALNSKCFSRFSKVTDDAILVVNISSLLGVQPYSGCALYCATKAAREMYFKTLVNEYDEKLLQFNDQSHSETTGSPSPSRNAVLRVLNYAPGPVFTDMARQISEQIVNPNTRERWEDRQPKLVTCEQTVTKLLAILRGNSFQSGAHLDYFDDLP